MLKGIWWCAFLVLLYFGTAAFILSIWTLEGAVRQNVKDIHFFSENLKEELQEELQKELQDHTSIPHVFAR